MHKLEIIMLDAETYAVVVKLACGYSDKLMHCKNEEEARVYARGVQDGFKLSLNAIGNGLRFDARIT